MVALPVIDAGNDVSVCEDTVRVTMVANQSVGSNGGAGINGSTIFFVGSVRGV